VIPVKLVEELDDARKQGLIAIYPRWSSSGEIPGSPTFWNSTTITFLQSPPPSILTIKQVVRSITDRYPELLVIEKAPYIIDIVPRIV